MRVRWGLMTIKRNHLKDPVEIDYGAIRRSKLGIENYEKIRIARAKTFNTK